MKIKILTPDENGLFSFTKSELESLLQESYNEGYEDGSSKLSAIYSEPVPYRTQVTCDSSRTTKANL